MVDVDGTAPGAASIPPITSSLRHLADSGGSNWSPSSWVRRPIHNPGSGLCAAEAVGKKRQQPVVAMELCGAAGQLWNAPAA